MLAVAREELAKAWFRLRPSMLKEQMVSWLDGVEKE